MAYRKSNFLGFQNFLNIGYEETQIEHHKAKAAKARARRAVEDASIFEQMAKMYTKSMEFRAEKEKAQ